MENDDVNTIITAHLGWAKSKASHLSKHYRVDFDDVFSYALEAIWRAISYKTEDDCNRNLRWFAAIFLKRRVVDMVRKAHTARRRILFEYADFEQVHAGSITFLTADNYPFEPREPCVDCGTTGGTAFSGRNHAARCHGRCLACYNQHFGRAKREKKKLMKLEVS